jgi:uncharacterized C2H2 Zn-finger protein
MESGKYDVHVNTSHLPKEKRIGKRTEWAASEL